jgi:succinate dehydrogenase / fumarate reductase cytochrome b subunit
MSATAADTGGKFYGTTIGKKIVMALTGAFLVLFLIGHVAGNLQILAGREKINHYAELLHSSMGLLWGFRIALIASVVLHVRAALQLYALKAAARPVQYAKKTHRVATLASRMMIWSGYVVGAFIIFHILHFTTGTVGYGGATKFIEGDVFENVTVAFKNPAIAGVYVVCMALIGQHLSHGLFSFTQSLGLSHPTYSARAKTVAQVVGYAVAAAFALVPIAVLAGVVGK